MEIPILDAPLYDVFFVQVSFAVPHATLHFFRFLISLFDGPVGTTAGKS